MVEIKCGKWLGAMMRCVEIDGVLWFVLRDLCNALDISCREVARSIRNRYGNEFIQHEYIPDRLGREQIQNIVIEDVVYTDIIRRSQKPAALKFRRWMGKTISDRAPWKKQQSV